MLKSAPVGQRFDMPRALPILLLSSPAQRTRVCRDVQASLCVREDPWRRELTWEHTADPTSVSKNTRSRSSPRRAPTRCWWRLIRPSPRTATTTWEAVQSNRKSVVVVVPVQRLHLLASRIQAPHPTRTHHTIGGHAARSHLDTLENCHGTWNVRLTGLLSLSSRTWFPRGWLSTMASLFAASARIREPAELSRR